MKEPGDGDILIGKLFDIPEALANEPRVLRHAHFGHVALDVQRISQREGRLPGRNQAPTHQDDKDDTSCRYGEPNQREVEHVEWNANLILAKIGNDDVWRRANQSCHPAQKGRERQGHEEARRRMFATVRYSNCHGQQKANGATLFMNAEKNADIPESAAILMVR